MLWSPPIMRCNWLHTASPLFRHRHFALVKRSESFVSTVSIKEWLIMLYVSDEEELIYRWVPLIISLIFTHWTNIPENKKTKYFVPRERWANEIIEAICGSDSAEVEKRIISRKKRHADFAVIVTNAPLRVFGKLISITQFSAQRLFQEFKHLTLRLLKWPLVISCSEA